MLASLPMYDFAHLRAHWMGFYQDLLAALPDDIARFAPRELVFGAAAFSWHDEVFLSMTCGAPLRNIYAGHLHPIAALDFGLCAQKGYYYSRILGAPGREKTVLAVNDFGSQSGFHAVLPILQGQGICPKIMISGSHEASLWMLMRREVDLCAIDAQTWRFICEKSPELAKLPQWQCSLPSPALPLVTSQARWVEPIGLALKQIIDEKPSWQKALHIRGLQTFTLEEYARISSAICTAAN